MKIGMKNPVTGEIKKIKVGWSWTLLFSSIFFGIPLFLRKLHVWGAVFFSLQLAFRSIEGSIPKTESSSIFTLYVIIFLVLSIWMALKGNKMTAKAYLEQGWTFDEPDSEEVIYAKKKWGFNI